ncbi:MAG TPA: hypothetical protein VMQ67_00635 [Candidatus Saccharimonadales bacterium]|nr:hypothetical protein [Candidatus Saccharimonadales bacterium]
MKDIAFFSVIVLSLALFFGLLVDAIFRPKRGKLLSLLAGSIVLFAAVSMFAQQTITNNGIVYVAVPGQTNLVAQIPVSTTVVVTTAPATNISQMLGLGTGVGSILGTIQEALTDAQPFITNDMLHVNGGGLYNNSATHGKFGGFLAATIPGAIAAQTSVGFGGAYLDKQWLEANVNIQLGTTITIPLVGPVYGWIASGPDFNIKSHAIGGYNFTGVTKAWRLSPTWSFLLSGGVGDFSTIPGTDWVGSIGFAKNF